jgi:alpha-D-xyloside xylohydrolase
MDFADDKEVLDISNQYMFGKSILVCPVVEPLYTVETGTGRNITRTADFSTVKTRKVYLPKGTDWYDFWTNEKVKGGQTVEREAPLDIMPLYVKTGSIIPIGPDVQYVEEKTWDNLELKVYAGANGSFTLYEDEFDNYNYEKGAYTEIVFSWNDASRTITIANRKGQYTGMPEQRNFNVTLIEAGKTNPSRQISYSGNKVSVKL